MVAFQGWSSAEGFAKRLALLAGLAVCLGGSAWGGTGRSGKRSEHVECSRDGSRRGEYALETE